MYSEASNKETLKVLYNSQTEQNTIEHSRSVNSSNIRTLYELKCWPLSLPF